MAADDLRNSFSLQKLVTMELPSMELGHSVPADDIVKSVKMCIIHRVTSLIIPQYTRAISQLTAVKRAWTTGRHFIARQKQLHPMHDI